jgi:hypothetical protein
MTSAQIRPFRIDVPQRDLDDLRARLTQPLASPPNRCAASPTRPHFPPSPVTTRAPLCCATSAATLTGRPDP